MRLAICNCTKPSYPMKRSKNNEIVPIVRQTQVLPSMAHRLFTVIRGIIMFIKTLNCKLPNTSIHFTIDVENNTPRSMPQSRTKLGVSNRGPINKGIYLPTNKMGTTTTLQHLQHEGISSATCKLTILPKYGSRY